MARLAHAPRGEVVQGHDERQADDYRVACVGDRIVARAQSVGEIVVMEGEEVTGLLVPGYIHVIPAEAGTS